jgi:DNA polymerase elongation subunit (family B)
MYQNIHFDPYKKQIHLWDDEKGHIVFPYKKYAYVKNSNGDSVSLYGDKVKKVYRWDDDQPNLFESDINPDMRVLVDMYTDSDDISIGHRKMYFDIEVEVTEGFPDPKKADNKIYSIAVYDDVTDEYFCYVLGEGKDNYNTNNIFVEFFSRESALLNSFFVKYNEIKPTIISGWNVDGFDVPYLYNRTVKVLGKDIANMLSPIHQVNWRDWQSRYIIAGVSCLDYLILYKRFTFIQKSSYRLDDIAKEEVGDAKIGYEGTLNDLYETDIQKFIDYNINDVKLIKKLDDKLDFITIARGICHLGHVPYEDILYSSRYLEGAILTYLKKIGVIAPNRDPKGKELIGRDEKIIGAYVQEPKRGKHDWVYDLDVTSMYPCIIMSLNISPETKIGKVIGWDAKQYVKGVKKTYTIEMGGKECGKFTTEEFQKFFGKNEVSISANGILYRNDKKGLIPTVLTTWFDKRVEYRKLMKKFGDAGDNDKYEYFKRRQHIQKIVLNSLYGVLGLPIFRFYDTDNAEAVTTTGQLLIKYTKKIGNHFYNKELETNDDFCIYVDTDSVFFSALPLIQNRFKDKTMSDVMMTQRILEIASEVQEFINDMYIHFANRFCNVSEHRFEIKQEIIAKSGLFITKKRYGMQVINDNGVKTDKILVKGLDTVRSNFPTAMRTLLKKVLEDILMNVPKDKIDETIVGFKNGMKKMGFDEISMPTGVKRIDKFIEKGDTGNSVMTSYKKATPIHVKSAMAYNDLLRYYNRDKKYSFISNGDKIRWVYLKQNPLGINTLAYKGHEDPIEITDYIKKYINHDKIFNQVLKKKIDMFYETMKWGTPVDKEHSIERFF